MPRAAPCRDPHDGAPGAPRTRRRAVRALWLVVGVALLLFVLQTLFFGVYRVGSESMEPTIHGGNGGQGGGDSGGSAVAARSGVAEWVLVRYSRAPELERFDLVVLRRAESEAPLVKRVVGLPGERVQIEGGDLLVDGRRLPPDAPRPAPIAVFDQELDALEPVFRFDVARWTAETNGIQRLDASDVARGADAGLMLFHPDLVDAFRGADGTLQRGTHQVNDGVLELEARCVSGAGRLVLRLVEAGDTFEARLEPLAAGRARVVLVRRTASDAALTLGERELACDTASWLRLCLANVDNHVSLDLDGARVLAATYTANVPWRGHPPEGVDRERVSPLRSVGSRVAFGAEGLVAEFRRVRILRDLFYVPAGDHAVLQPLELGPHEVFVLGDNSAHSQDGRHSGPTRLDEVLGRPLAVVWPFRRLRRLEGASGRSGR